MLEDISLTGKRWLTTENSAQNAGNIVAHLLHTRQFDVPVSPQEFPAMEQAVEHILSAVQRREPIAIFGDYDCDGVTATAQLVRFFQRRGIHPLVRLPHRIRDGYGLNDAIVEEFYKAGVQLLITVDTGISAVREIEHAKQCGIDTIVTDHHAVGKHIAPATVVLHPGLAGCPEPHPSGSGVAFLLLSALEGGVWNERPIDLVLAMCGTIADLVELRGWNRQLVREGLEALENIEDGPLMLLRERTNTRTSTDVAFRIAPRINAAGRMADPILALHALLEGGETIAMLDALNTERQEKTSNLYREIHDSVDKNSPLLWAANEQYPCGLIGLIAGKLTEATGKPSCIVTMDKEQCTASLRSPSCYHITEGLTRCAELLTRFGGHARAAGCNFPLKHLEDVRERLSSDIATYTNPHELQPCLQVDAGITPEDITLAFCETLELLEPFGAGNPEPRFLLRGVHLEEARTVGADSTHLQCSIAGRKAIGFGLASLLHRLTTPLDVLCRLQVDRWNGNMQPRLIIDDLRVARGVPVTN